MIKIKLVILGHFPNAAFIDKIKNWKSDLFRISEFCNYNIVGDSDGLNWEFLDINVERQLPVRLGLQPR